MDNRWKFRYSKESFERSVDAGSYAKRVEGMRVQRSRLVRQANPSDGAELGWGSKFK